MGTLFKRTIDKKWSKFGALPFCLHCFLAFAWPKTSWCLKRTGCKQTSGWSALQIHSATGDAAPGDTAGSDPYFVHKRPKLSKKKPSQLFIALNYKDVTSNQ